MAISFVPACKTVSVQLDVVECGIDHALDVAEGDVDITQYPWVGVLFYTYCEFILDPLCKRTTYGHKTKGAFIFN